MNNSSQFYIGVVENRFDPLKLGRCQVRIIGLHIHDKNVLPTEELPWAYPMQPATSAAMTGIGHAPVGPVEGTSVVVVFSDYPDNQQPIILGTLGGIPQTESVNIGKIDDEAIFKNPATGEGESVPTTPQEAVTQSQQTAPSTPTTLPNIPTTPPPSFKGNRSAAEAGIKALLQACDDVGLTTREQKCALLAITGGESGWIPQKEDYVYSAPRLQEVFKSTFGGKPDLATKYAKWQGSRESFFNFVYAPENNGRSLGNTKPEDGGKFYGRGFIQLTGRANYTKFAQLAGVDLLGNPELLNSSLATSAKVAALYLKTRVSSSVVGTSNPGYYIAAKSAVGYNTPDIDARKTSYYEYFYGMSVGSTSSEKTAGYSPVTSTETNVVPGSNSGASVVGFKDPNNKYPLPNLVNEPDTNRLARSITKETIVPLKDSQRAVGIPKAIGQGTFDQPTIPYGAEYPFNHVFETESGHIQEFDDTAGYERVHLYHRKGTFIEIDANGTEVHKIVGDGYTIIDRNGSIYVRGQCNMTVDGNVNIFCRSDAYVEVAGNMVQHVGGNYDINVAGDMTVTAGGALNMWGQQEVNMQTGGAATVKAGSNLDMTGSGKVNVTGGSIAADGGTINLNSGVATAAKDVKQTPIGAGDPIRPSVDYLTPPPLRGEEAFMFETEEEWNSEAGQAARRDIAQQHGDQTPNNTPAQDTAKASGGTNAATNASCALIFSSTNFSSTYRLSANFTLGMLFDGGYNVRHILQDQNGLTKQQIVCNLAQVCANILEPYAKIMPGGMGGYGKLWKINSGYRMQSGSSDHGLGRAIDVGLIGGTSRNQATFELVKQLDRAVPYDQMILEYRTPGQVWIHTSYRGINAGDTAGGGVNRKMAFTMLNDRTYGQGFILI